MAMNEFRKDFQPMQGRFLDRAGKAARDENTYWTPIVVTKKEIDAEVERLASLPQPANGRRESLIAHPLAAADAPGFAPGIQVKLSVLKPAEKTAAFRHNATEVNFCIRGTGHAVVAGKRIAFSQYDVWNHPSYAIYRHINDGKNLQVRLTYSNAPLLQHMQIYLPEDEPAAERHPVEDAEERARARDPRGKSPYGMIRVGADGGMLMPYEILINPGTVESKPLHFPWQDVKHELDKLEALGKDYVGRRLYMMYNPMTGRRRSWTGRTATLPLRSTIIFTARGIPRSRATATNGRRAISCSPPRAGRCIITLPTTIMCTSSRSRTSRSISSWSPCCGRRI